MKKSSKKPAPPKKTPAVKPAADVELVSKLIRWPADWVERVDSVRGELSFSDFVRQAVLKQIDTKQEASDCCDK